MTISYGAWPSEVLLLFFGFLPSEGAATHEGGGGGALPNETACLFLDLFDLTTFHQRCARQQQQLPVQQPGAAAAEEEEAAEERAAAAAADALAVRLGCSDSPERYDRSAPPPLRGVQRGVGWGAGAWRGCAPPSHPAARTPAHPVPPLKPHPGWWSPPTA